MKVEIWSDVACPFCYIGKVNFEKALGQFENHKNVEIEWKSFQLAPDLVSDPSKNTTDYLVEYKGISIEKAQEMQDQVSNMAIESGLIFNMDKTQVANTHRAHQMIHFAKKHGVQNQAKALAFRAYFSDGQNLDDLEVLSKIVSDCGLDTDEFRQVLENKTYAHGVAYDMYEAKQIGVRGVPYFVFDEKYAVSGAQPAEVFLEVLEKASSLQS